MTGRRAKLGVGILLFLGGFAVALAAGWWLFGSGTRQEQAARVETLREADLNELLAAVESGDYHDIKRLGEAMLKPGTRVAEGERMFAPYAVNSLPPYSVYALYTYNDPDRTRRVLLTLGDDGRVESFLAEEMAVIK
ncbi:MAG: hypothetical protein LUC93_02220 [Planctomycetaceae bacterium]|nr:hypothetical protein [Planctomycetaceae bacterium]